MKNNIKLIVALFIGMMGMAGCTEKEYTLGDLAAPTNLSITTVVEGVDATHPNGDGSGNVKISVKGDNALTYKMDFDAADGITLVHVPSGMITRKYTSVGLHTYQITAVVYGKGGTSSTVTGEVTVVSKFSADPALVTNVTGNASKTWAVEKAVPGHFGVGPWAGDFGPSWWSAPPNDKEACCNCFYLARFVFSQVSPGTYTLQTQTPGGAFTKTGSLAGIPGIPATGDEGCYPYAGGTTPFSFIPASSGAPTTTGTVISLGGTTTFIGYGAALRDYEILSVSATNMYLRLHGTEPGNAWYLKLIAL